jgi:UDP-N-acetylglucosamine 2-epimerase (non-hydrolysing)
MKVLCVVGTRPEAIKMAPVILAVRDVADTVTLLTGQHTTLAEEALSWFGITADAVFDIPLHDRTLARLTAELIPRMDAALEQHRPDVVLAQGDTTTVMVTALVAFYRRVAFGHVEAGLRTGDLSAPFPEEYNRVVASRTAAFHFCPTERAVGNLRREGVPGTIVLTGNTVIDALRHTLAKVPERASDGPPRILLTAHRRENHGIGLDAICDAVLRLVADVPGLVVSIPVHPNPEVRRRVEARLSGPDRVHLLPPLRYPDLVAEMRAATVILTDSGGIQEEAPFLGKPVLVLRDVTERPEAVELGLARLVGTDTETIVAATRELLENPAAYAAMTRGGSPYGDGRAARRIVEALGLSA